MRKQEFLEKLKLRLAKLPQREVDERLSFYGEMIDDRIEEGVTEEEAVSQIGSVEEIAAQILSDISLAKIVKERMMPKRALKWWEIVLLIMAAPILLVVLASVLAAFISLYAAAFLVVVSAWAVGVSLVAYAVFGSGIAIVMVGEGVFALAHLGMALFALGLSFFVFLGTKKLTLLSWFFTKKLVLWIKTLFIGKESGNE